MINHWIVDKCERVCGQKSPVKSLIRSATDLDISQTSSSELERPHDLQKKTCSQRQVIFLWYQFMGLSFLWIGYPPKRVFSLWKQKMANSSCQRRETSSDVAKTSRYIWITWMGVGPTNPSLRMEKGRSSSCQPIIATNNWQTRGSTLIHWWPDNYWQPK